LGSSGKLAAKLALVAERGSARLELLLEHPHDERLALVDGQRRRLGPDIRLQRSLLKPQRPPSQSVRRATLFGFEKVRRLTAGLCERENIAKPERMSTRSMRGRDNAQPPSPELTRKLPGSSTGCVGDAGVRPQRRLLHITQRVGQTCALFLIGAAALLAGCGGGGGEEPSSAEVAARLADAIRDNGQGHFAEVKCVPRGDNVFRCLGELTPSRAVAKDQLEGVPHTERDIQAVIRSGTTEVVYEVTVDPDDGSFIYE
jgi:hypothetical protein